MMMMMYVCTKMKFLISLLGLKLETGVHWNMVKYKQKSCCKIFKIIGNDHVIAGKEVNAKFFQTS